MSHEKCLFIRKNDMSKGNEFSQILNSIIKDQQSETDLSWTQDLEIETFHIHFATKTNEQSDEKKINSSIRNTPYFRVGLNKSFSNKTKNAPYTKVKILNDIENNESYIEPKFNINNLNAIEMVSFLILSKWSDQLKTDWISLTQLKKAYREAIKKTHPDVSNNLNSEDFIGIQTAYKCVEKAIKSHLNTL